MVWTLQTSAANNSWLSVAWSPSLSLFAAVALDGSGNRIMTSPDGITWTSRTSPTAGGEALWLDVIWVPGSVNLFIAVAGGGFVASIPRIMTSPDGITWTTRTGVTLHDWRGLAYSPSLGLITAVAGDSGQGTSQFCMTSTNGTTWTMRTTPTSSPPHRNWMAVDWSPTLNLFAAVAFNATSSLIMTCPNPATTSWTLQTVPAAALILWRDMCWCGGTINKFVAVASTGVTTGRVMTSSDGITWTMRVAATGNDWFSVVYSPELDRVFACSNNSLAGVDDRVMSSKDGIVWTTDPSPASNTNSWRGLAWSPALSRFVGVASGGTAGSRVMTSTVFSTTLAGTLSFAGSLIGNIVGALYLKSLAGMLAFSGALAAISGRMLPSEAWWGLAARAVKWVITKSSGKVSLPARPTGWTLPN